MALPDEHAYTLRCNRDTWDELESYARELDVSLNSVLNLLLHMGLKAHRGALTAAVRDAKSKRLTTRYRRTR